MALGDVLVRDVRGLHRGTPVSVDSDVTSATSLNAAPSLRHTTCSENYLENYLLGPQLSAEDVTTGMFGVDSFGRSHPAAFVGWAAELERRASRNDCDRVFTGMATTPRGRY